MEFQPCLGGPGRPTIAVERSGTGRAAMANQLPLAALMIGYTTFGLWLLAAPTAG